ncbi:LacI family transcriptional regulator [Arthrobacter psychrolactophilus]|uniref:LacI family transcriptional regulator n=1 Tax=Arthrobacter psychrolactophilus TaxID=92442 RepID=A0A2V5ISC3_9MICC|nr:LacI family DNA-binding transcriptional regulator [Arthrobacter psychrolactophilus]PYI39425.1 LacI family transcriptional regulator [Arthrobacter psychrolactophilus]
MSPTIHDVARAAGVSIKTVSNVVNDNPKVGPETRLRVHRIIEALGYRPNLSARGLRSGKSGVIGLAVPSLRENYFAELADSVIRAAKKHDLRVLIEQTDGDRQQEISILTGGRMRFIDGLLFSPAEIGQQDVDVLSGIEPIVLLGERIFGGPTDHVTMHNTSSAKAATEHLLDLGRRRIALIGASDSADDAASSANLRERGYHQALAEAGIEEDPRLVIRGGKWTRETGLDGVRHFISNGIVFDAIFALNDTLALGALRALVHAGLRVPEDVALIGFDNIDEGSFSIPTLTSVDPGRLEIAETAVDLLIERINEKGERSAPRTVKAAFSIIKRESTGFATDDAGPPQ